MTRNSVGILIAIAMLASAATPLGEKINFLTKKGNVAFEVGSHRVRVIEYHGNQMQSKHCILWNRTLGSYIPRDSPNWYLGYSHSKKDPYLVMIQREDIKAPLPEGKYIINKTIIIESKTKYSDRYLIATEGEMKGWYVTLEKEQDKLLTRTGESVNSYRLLLTPDKEKAVSFDVNNWLD